MGCRRLGAFYCPPSSWAIPAGRLIWGRRGYTAGFVRPCPRTRSTLTPYPMAEHPVSPGALPGTRVGAGEEEDAEARQSSVHVARLVPSSPHSHQPAVYFRPSGSCPSQWSGFCPREPSSPVEGQHPKGKDGGEEENPTACLVLKPQTRHASVAKGQVWAGECMLSPSCHPPGWERPFPWAAKGWTV